MSGYPEKAGGAWPNLPDQHIQLEPDQESYQPGDTARIFLPNPFPKKRAGVGFHRTQSGDAH